MVLLFAFAPKRSYIAPVLHQTRNNSMATIRKSITFTDKLSEWMQVQITNGDYANESEYVRDLVRKDRAKNAKLRALTMAIEEGLESGVGNKTVPQIMKEVEGKLKKGGRL